jgi:hypothetical protein
MLEFTSSWIPFPPAHARTCPYLKEIMRGAWRYGADCDESGLSPENTAYTVHLHAVHHAEADGPNMRFPRSYMGHIVQHFGCDKPFGPLECDLLKWSGHSNSALRRSPCLGNEAASSGKFARFRHFRVFMSDFN